VLHRFQRISLLIGSSNMERLAGSSVLVLGVGGVGGYVVEALVRSGVGEIILVDFDYVEESNINRQIIALVDTIGRSKVDVFEERIRKINPSCKVTKINEFINNENIDLLFQSRIDFFVDACDSVKTKLEVIKKCLNQNIKFISCMGTGNRLDPSKLQITNLDKTFNDSLARVMRQYVRKEKIRGKIKVLSSEEVPVKIGCDVIASTAFVPAVAGELIAGYVVRELIGLNGK